MEFTDKDKISVAPHFFNYSEYFEELTRFFNNWEHKQIKRVEKKYGKKSIQRVINGKFPPSPDEEEKNRKTLKGNQLKKWEDTELKSMLAMANLNDITVQDKAFYNSFLLFIYSDFENILDGICNEYASKTNQDILLKDINGRGIERSNLYLSKVAKFKLPNQELCKDVFLLRDIRNCLVHAGGVTGSQDLITRVTKTNVVHILDIEYSQKKDIFIDEAYCSHSIGILTEYLMELVKKNDKFLWHWSHK